MFHHLPERDTVLYQSPSARQFLYKQCLSSWRQDQERTQANHIQNRTLLYYYICVTMLTLLLKFTFFNNRALQTRPIQAVNETLNKFLKERIDKAKYEASFSAYQSYIERVLAENPSVTKDKLRLLELCTKIHSIYNLQSKKLQKIHNQITSQCLQLSRTPAQTIQLITLINRYNPKKALAIFKQNKSTILSKLRSLAPPIFIELLRFLSTNKIDDPIIRQTSIQILFGELSYLNQSQLVTIGYYLSMSKKYVNKQFLTHFCRRVSTMYFSNSLERHNAINLMDNISEIQVNLHTRSIYIEELDQMYEKILPSLFDKINQLSDRMLNQLTNCLRRSKMFQQGIMIKLQQQMMRRDIIQLSNPEAKGNLMHLATFVNIVNTFAVFNYSHPSLKKYILFIAQIIAQHQQLILNGHNFSRLLWSFCVLYEPKQVAELHSLYSRHLAFDLPLHQAMNFYYCYLYLRTSFPPIADYRDRIHKLLTGFHLQTNTSRIQLQAFDVLKQIGVPCISEYNLNNLICDFMIPSWKSLNNVIIEFHGFRHFCRNVKRLTGSSTLKQKIIEGQMYSYHFISIDQWLITQNKVEFMKEFMDNLDEIYSQRIESKEVALQTSQRIRNRPKRFRVTSS